jgi:predicted transcriptional regulator
MEKRISYSQFQQVKSAAKMMDPNMRKIEALKKKIMPLVEEMKALHSLNNSLEEGIVRVIGIPVYQLVKKVIEPTGAVGKDGKPIKVTKYLPTDAVSYDEQKKQYVIQIADDEETIVPPTTENVAGSDFDKDAEALKTHEEESEKEATEQEVNLPWNN